MAKLKILYYLKVAIITLGQLSIRISFFICITVYTYGVGNITAEKAFVVLGCYSSLQYVLNTAIPNGISLIAEAKSSIKRIKAMLMAPEVDEIPPGEGQPCIKTKNLFAQISNETILHGINLHLTPGLHGLCGPVGSGKSTLLKVLLNELSIDEGSCKMNGSVSYASQDPFLFNGTIQQNILFGLPFDFNRYKDVIKMCGLGHDINRFAKGDQTLLNDRGVNLSKGQQARVNLARSVYRDADVYILDDPLSSIDSNLSKEIFTNLIVNFLAKKLCLLVTGQLQLLKDCSSVIVMEAGTIKYHGPYDNGQLSDLEVSGGVMEELLPIESTQLHAEEIIDKDEVNDKSKLLTSNDEKNKKKKKPGNVEFGVYKAYFRFIGQYKVIGLFLWLCICQICVTYFDYFICEWIKVEDSLLLFQSNNTNSTSYQHIIDARSKMPYIYTSLIATTILMSVGCSYVIFALVATAHEKLHFASFTKILQAPASFFDSNSCGNILNRFSKDVSIIDEQVPFLINECVKLGLMLIGLIGLTLLADTRSIILPIIFAAPLYVCRSIYLPTSRSLKRLDGETKSPVIGHLSATLEGITTIRANKAQEIVKHEFDKYQNVHSSTAYMYMTASRAFTFVLDLVCAIYMVVVFSILMLKSGISAGIVGLILTKTFELNSILQYGMRQWAELENQMTSVERVLEYTDVESEHKILGAKRTSLKTRGKVQFKQVHLRYPKTGELILKDINFTVEPGQKIGIVGRTGSGKSSIISALFRLYDLDSGAILIDDRDVRDTDVQILRSNMSVIPQNPVIFSGSLRANLDPEQESSDADLWNALNEVLMKPVISNVDLELDCGVGDRGLKFSTGQKQLICLARAINRRNKILVLDEATSSVDQNTSTLIEAAIRRNFPQCTIFMITHKLNSVLSMDKIMVVNNGRIVEFDYTNALLNDKNSTFFQLVSQSGLIK